MDLNYIIGFNIWANFENAFIIIFKTKNHKGFKQMFFRNFKFFYIIAKHILISNKSFIVSIIIKIKYIYNKSWIQLS